MNIQTITLRDVLVSGRHGATTVEQETTQPFSVSADLSFDATVAINSKSLSSTINYYDIAELIRKEIEGSSCTLLETLVQNTATRLAQTFPITALDLSIQKMHIALRPKIALKRNYFSKRGTVQIRSFEELHSEIIDIGITATPFLSESELEGLLQFAQTQEYIPQPEIAKNGIVREQLSSAYVTKESQLPRVVADKVAVFLSQMQNAIGINLFEIPFCEKEVVLQKYEKGSIGITPHRDEKSFRNVVCIIPLKGKGRLAVCDDRSGANPIPTDTTPGNLILLRAPGYAGMSVRPMHFVSDITEERIIVGVRFPRN